MRAEVVVVVVLILVMAAVLAMPRTMSRRDEAAKALGARHVAQKPGNETFQLLCWGMCCIMKRHPTLNFKDKNCSLDTR